MMLVSTNACWCGASSCGAVGYFNCGWSSPSWSRTCIMNENQWQMTFNELDSWRSIYSYFSFLHQYTIYKYHLQTIIGTPNHPEPPEPSLLLLPGHDSHHHHLPANSKPGVDIIIIPIPYHTLSFSDYSRSLGHTVQQTNQFLGWVRIVSYNKLCMVTNTRMKLVEQDFWLLYFYAGNEDYKAVLDFVWGKCRKTRLSSSLVLQVRDQCECKCFKFWLFSWVFFWSKL